MNQTVSLKSADILARLRRDTADAHAALERDLDLLRPPVTLPYMRNLLGRFLGFHLAWEPAIRAALRDEPDLVEPRMRLQALAGDLEALGVGPAEQAALPVDRAAGELAPDPATALGSLYVVEGSALGGQLITRALKDAEWLPEGGLRFFSPYGSEVGAMWQGFRQRLVQVSSETDQAKIVAGAQATFAALHHWMQPVFRNSVSES